MSHQELQPITEAFDRINNEQAAFATEIDHLLGRLNQLCHEVEARASWVEQRQREIQAADVDLFSRLSEKLDQIVRGDGGSLHAIADAMRERIKLHDEGDVESQRLQDAKQQNARLAAELKLARARSGATQQDGRSSTTSHRT
ncbi:MAG: hypothetical protein R3C05_29410 [Pirellulaceae bacterium]